jgi:bifunctional non-homologous end joining protein LigD
VRGEAPDARDLTDYRAKRRAGATPEPMPPRRKRSGDPRPDRQTFVVQEHHASSLHWDFRLERDGVLVSWALPKGLPDDPGKNHLAVPTEDHPLEYATFAGTIPEGEYGGGVVTVWDHGTYECETWTDHEVKVVLHGDRVDGRYALFPTRPGQWMIHRMEAPARADLVPAQWVPPMLATPGPLAEGGPDDWAYEFKWDGVRAALQVVDGRPSVTSRNGRDLTPSFPELRHLAEAFGSRQAVLDGELVVLDEGGVPSFARIQRRIRSNSATGAGRRRDPVSYIVFDLLHVDGQDLLGRTYDDRRRLLEEVLPAGSSWVPTPSFTGPVGTDVLTAAIDMGMEGVVAKRRSSVYRPGKRSPDWVKTKPERTQEVVVGGWTTGEGERRGTFGALILGIPHGGGGTRPLRFVGKVGSGFDDAARQALLREMRPLQRATAPFDPEPPTSVARDATWVRPVLVGEVRFREWTADARLRHPVWRGRRDDKGPEEVTREP